MNAICPGMVPKTLAAAFPLGIVVGADLELLAVVTGGLVTERLVVVAVAAEVEDPTCRTPVAVVGLALLVSDVAVAADDRTLAGPERPAVAEANGVALPAEHVKAPSPAQIIWPWLGSPTQQTKFEMSSPLQPPTIDPGQQKPL